MDEFKELSLDSMYKKLNDLKKINKVKIFNPQTDEKETLKLKVLDNVRDLFNDLYHIYKDKYNEEKAFYYKKLRLADDYQYESEEEKEQQTSKKEPPKKKPTEEDASSFNEWVNKKETNINSGIFQKFFKFQRPSDMFKHLHKANNKEKKIKI